MSTATATKKKPKANAPATQKASASAPKALTKPPVKAKPAIDKPAIVAAPTEPAHVVNTDLVHEVPHAIGSVWRERRSNVRRSQTNPRTVFVLDDLLATMPTQGQLSPVLVRFRPDTDSDTDYEIVDGERRDRSAEQLGWNEIEVKLVEMTDEQVEEAQLVANLARADLTPLDEAHAFERLERRGYSVQQIADRVGKRQDYIRQRLALARLTDEAKAALRDGAISVGAAQELAAVTDAAEQRRVVARALEGRAPGADPMTAKQIRMFVEQALLVLSKAKFPLADATLVPAAGACTTCPKRSSQQFALIALPGADVDERCTDRSCFVAKQEAHWTRSSEDARAAGQTVVEGDAARKLVAFGGIAKDSGYVDLDAHCAELRDGRTWREVVGDAPLPVTLVRGAEGAAHTTVPKADAVRVLRDRGLLRAPEPQKPAAPAAPANDATPESEEHPAANDGPAEPTLLTVDQIARAAKKARLDSDTFAALTDAIILLSEPRPAETQAICKPYDVPVPEDAEGSDVVLGIARSLTNDGDRLALVVRALCVNEKARARLSVHFAPGQNPDASIADAKERALHAIRTGATKPAQIRAAAGIDEDTWERVIAALKRDGAVRAESRGRGQTYVVVDAPAATDLETTATEPPVDDALAVSTVDESIRDNVRDLLARGSLDRAELSMQLAELEGLSEGDADREIETMLREGLLSASDDGIEWADNRDPTPFERADTEHEPRVVF